MRRHMRMLPVCLVAMVSLLITPPKLWAANFAEKVIFFEFNSTDLDLGIHISFDAVAWNEVHVTDPDGITIFWVMNEGSLRDIGSTSVFTESAEPPLDEDDLAGSIAAFQAQFPEGKYSFEGTTTEEEGGKTLTGTAELLHALPVAVGNLAFNGSKIAWTQGPPGPEEEETVGYQAIYEFLEQGGDKRLFVFSADLPATAMEVTVPADFLSGLPNCSLAKVEVLAIGANGNKTITEAEVDCP